MFSVKLLPFFNEYHEHIVKICIHTHIDKNFYKKKIPELILFGYYHSVFFTISIFDH